MILLDRVGLNEVVIAGLERDKNFNYFKFIFKLFKKTLRKLTL